MNHVIFRCGLLLLGTGIAVSQSAAARATTIVHGGTIGDQTWRLADSPYIIEGDVVVGADAILRIQEGVEVRFADADSQFGGADPSRIELIVLGGLIVDSSGVLEGSPTQPVLFRGHDRRGPGTWAGISLPPGDGVVQIYGAVISDADVAVSCARPNAKVRWSSFDNNRTALALDDACYVEGVIVQRNGAGIDIELGAVAPRVMNSVVANNTTGIAVFGAEASSALWLTNVTIAGNEHGLLVDNAYVQVVNSIIAQNPIEATDAEVLIRYSDLWSAAIDGSVVNVATGNLFLDPQFVSPFDDLRLSSRSPCIGSGNNSFIGGWDPDGVERPTGGSDIGAFEHVALDPLEAALAALAAEQVARVTCDASREVCEGARATCDASLSTCAGSLATCDDSLAGCDDSLASCDDLFDATLDALAVERAALAACDTSLGSCNGLLAMCDVSLATCDVSLTTCDVSLATCDGSLAACDGSLVACDSERDALAAALAAVVPVSDSDSDGVSDARDRCPGTAAGSVTDDGGCTVSQFCERQTVRGVLDALTCRALDWGNDEPLIGLLAADCRAVVTGLGVRCVAAP